MKRIAPLLTLAAVAALGATLFAVNAVTGDAPTAQPAAAAATGSAKPAPPPAPAAPTEPAAPPPAVADMAYTGRSSGDEVTVAVAVKDGRAVGYVCDGEQIEAWVEGTIEGDQISLQSADGTTTVTGTVDQTAAFGAVTVGDRQWPYSAEAVQVPGGLYEGRGNVDGVAARIGWIVENDGRVTGLLRAAGSPEPRPAPAFDPTAPGSVTLDGAPVVVTPVDGDDQVVAR